MWKNYSLSPTEKKESGIKKEIQRTIKSFVLFMWCIHAFGCVEAHTHTRTVHLKWKVHWVSFHFYEQTEFSMKSQTERILSSIYWVSRVKCVYKRTHIPKWKWNGKFSFSQIIMFIKTRSNIFGLNESENVWGKVHRFSQPFDVP